MQRDGLPLTEPELVAQCEQEYEDAAQHGGQVRRALAHLLPVAQPRNLSPRLPALFAAAHLQAWRLPPPRRRRWMPASALPGRWCTRPCPPTSPAALSSQRRCPTILGRWTSGT